MRRPRPGAVRALIAVLCAGLLNGAATAATPSATRFDFALVSTGNRAYSVDSFAADSVLVIYFGYTTCLRACPLALDNIAAAVDGLGAQGAAVQPLFIDVDPERAAQANLPLFMQAFGPRFLGLSGSPAAIAQATEAFGIRIGRVRFSDDPNDYAMTHTSPIFVMRPGDAEPVPVPATSPPPVIEATLRAALERPPSR